MNHPLTRVILIVAGIAAVTLGVLTFREGLHELSGKGLPSKDSAATEARQALATLESVPLPTHGLTIRCPRGWERTTPSEGPLALRFNTWKGVVNGSVAVQDVAEGTTSQSYAELNLVALRESFDQNQLKLTAEAPVPTNVGGLPGVMLRCSYRLADADVLLQVTQVYAVANGRGYAITFTAPAEIAAEFGALVQEILATAKFG